jgi:predicted transcriptional regulator
VGVYLPAAYNPKSRVPARGSRGSQYQGAHVSTAKEELTRLIQDQPEDSSAEEIVRELAFHVMVERGLADSDARRIVSNEETARRIRSWRS